jgi:type II secretory pathway component PulK
MVTATLIKRARARRKDGEKGVALLVVLVVIAILTATLATFQYETYVDLTTAIRARDELRAHYAARSSIQLSRLLLALQPTVDKAVKQFGSAIGLTELPLWKYSKFLLAAFQEGGEQGGGALALLGLDLTTAKGLGLGVTTSDVWIASEDGKINVNAAYSLDETPKKALAGVLAALIVDPRYNYLFEYPDASGQVIDRNEVVRAIIDFIDPDATLYGTPSSAEDYRYDQLADPYWIKNNKLDTLEELHLVRGVNDDFMELFGSALTVYGSDPSGASTVNINDADAVMIKALIRQYAQNEADPMLQATSQDAFDALVDATVNWRDLTPFKDGKAFQKFVKNPVTLTLEADPRAPQLTGVALKDDVQKAIRTTRSVFRIVAAAEVGRVRRRIETVIDTRLVNSETGEQGVLVYWHEE